MPTFSDRDLMISLSLRSITLIQRAEDELYCYRAQVFWDGVFGADIEMHGLPEGALVCYRRNANERVWDDFDSQINAQADIALEDEDPPSAEQLINRALTATFPVTDIGQPIHDQIQTWQDQSAREGTPQSPPWDHHRERRVESRLGNLRGVASRMGMRPLIPEEYAEYNVGPDALITQIMIYPADPTDLVIDDRWASIETVDEDDQLRRYTWGLGLGRYEIELMAALVIALAAYPDGITLTALLKLGWQPTSDSPEP